MLLRQNHRQGAEGEWANSLNRFRLGIAAPEDEETLRERIIPADTVDINSLLICYKNKKSK